jgi:hypothetical protein
MEHACACGCVWFNNKARDMCPDCCEWSRGMFYEYPDVVNDLDDSMDDNGYTERDFQDYIDWECENREFDE